MRSDVLDFRSKDGKVLSSAKRIKISAEDGGRYSLSISDVESSDDGKYTVRAFNDFGESRFTATVLVRGRFYFNCEFKRNCYQGIFVFSLLSHVSPLLSVRNAPEGNRTFVNSNTTLAVNC